MKKFKGAYTIELAVIFPTILGLSLLFFSLISSINRQQELENSFYEVVDNFRYDIYIFNKLIENTEMKEKINNINSNFLNKKIIEYSLSKKLQFDLLNRLKEKKGFDIKDRVIDYYHFYNMPKFKIITSNDEILVSMSVDLKNINLINRFKRYKFIVNSNIKGYDIGKYIKDDINEESKNGNDNHLIDNEHIFITENGLNKTYVYHIYDDCQGLLFADNIMKKQGSWKHEVDTVVIDGKKCKMCKFCARKLRKDIEN